MAEIIKCNRCGESKDITDFYESHRLDRSWCIACYRRWHRERYQPKSGGSATPRACAHCGVIYVPKQRRPSTFCSRECKDGARREQARTDRLASKPVDRKCVWCGELLPQSKRSEAQFCSAECNSAAHQTARKWKRRAGDRVKPRKIPLPSIVDIGDKAGWVCQICGKPVNRRRKYPDPLAASLDHVLPLSKGGTNDIDNIQLTHFRCNWRKRDKTDVSHLRDG